MVFSTQLDPITPERDPIQVESTLPTAQSLTTTEQENDILKRIEHLRPDASNDIIDWFFRDTSSKLTEYHKKIKPAGLPLDRPWLPLSAKRILRKMKRGPITEKEFVKLMGLVSERASEHFELDEGKFVALTLHGQVVEVSDTRIDLLKRIQGQTHGEKIFVCRVAHKAFSGRT